MPASASTRSSRQSVGPCSHEAVLKAILAREAQGLPLNRVAVSKDDPRLHQQIVRLYGVWDEAMRAAGIDPRRVRRHRRWSRKAVIERIQQRHAEALPVSGSAVQRSESRLANAAYRYFDSWADALAAAGIEPYRRRAPTWTCERVIEAIQQRHRQGAPLNHAAVRSHSLSRAAVTLFGSWDAALQQAGIDPAAVRRYRKPWTRDELLEELRRKHAAGEPLNAKDVRPNHIRRPAARLFGSWEAALVAAGLDPETIRNNKRRAQASAVLLQPWLAGNTRASPCPHIQSGPRRSTPPDPASRCDR